MAFYEIIATPVGDLTVREEEGAIVRLDFGIKHGNAERHMTPLITQTKNQLDEYFSGKRKNFDLPMNPAGTDFQQKTWLALRTIPYGETRSYGDIARQIGNPAAARAIGMANNRNPIPIIVPCHRVIGANGLLVGYGGGLPIKQSLLALEKSMIKKTI